MNPRIIKQESGPRTDGGAGALARAGPPGPANVEPTAERASRVVRRDTYQATLDAGAIVEAARRQAETILQEAEQQKAQALVEGREQGRREGLAEWAETVFSARSARDAALAKHEADLLRLAVRAAEKIVGQELRSHPDTIVAIVRECLKSVRTEHTLIVQLNPEDADEVRRNIERLMPAAGAAEGIRVVVDPAVRRGGCVVESDSGIADARLETQLQYLEQILLRAARK